MSTLSQYEGWDIEGIVERNSHELTAMHVLQARAYIVEQIARHEDEMDRLRFTLDEAHRIGLAVMRAKHAGRKTVRIDEVTK